MSKNKCLASHHHQLAEAAAERQWQCAEQHKTEEQMLGTQLLLLLLCPSLLPIHNMRAILQLGQ